MCSYNKIYGSWACENNSTLMRDLKHIMQFPGFVMSDWGATHSTSIEAGLAMLSLAEEYGAQGTGLQRTAWEQKIPSEFMKSVHQWRYALWATAFMIGCISLAVIRSRRPQLRRPATP